MSWDDLHEKILRVEALDEADVARSQELGTALSFDRAARTISGLKSILRHLHAENGHLLPGQITRALSQRLQNILDQVGAIRTFRPDQSANPGADRNSMEDNIEQYYADAFPMLVEAIAATSFGIEGESIQEKLRQIRSWAETETAKLIDDAKSNAEDLQRLLEESRKRAAEVIASKEAEHFKRTSDAYGNAALFWLKATVTTAGALLIGAAAGLALALAGVYDKLTPASVAQVALSKIILLGVLAYGTSLSARNYFANKHNRTVNEHRSNAVSSYRALVEAANTPENRDLILAHAASAVFSPQDTAYAKSTPTAPEFPTTIINSLAKPLAASGHV